MGEVYQATDTKLKRQVAIKVLPAAVTTDPDWLARFQREAQSLARLNHPNVVTIYAVDEINSVHFLVLELVEGQSLEQVLTRGPLALDVFFGIVIPLIDALAAAHGHGITHRDLKPANVMVTTQTVKVLDFGIAKLAATLSDLDETVTHGLTQQGRAVGTLPYMSPEQVEGGRIDRRSDIFSLGGVMYELLIGERPFQGGSGAMLASAILKDTPTPMSDRHPQVPRTVAGIVQRCLAKSPGQRYQSADELLRDMRAARDEHDSGAVKASQATAQSNKSIAVLPFANMSADPENEFFSDGISEEIISALAQIPDLRVTARTSSFFFKGKNVDLREVGEKLNVQTVLEGSVRKAGKRIRITAQLVNVADGYQIWSERYNRELEDVFEIQDEIARTIADRMKVTLKGDGDRPLVKAATENLEAYELYLKGRHYWHQRSPTTLRIAIQCFEETIKLDSCLRARLRGARRLLWSPSRVRLAIGRAEPTAGSCRRDARHDPVAHTVGSGVLAGLLYVLLRAQLARLGTAFPEGGRHQPALVAGAGVLRFVPCDRSARGGGRRQTDAGVRAGSIVAVHPRACRLWVLCPGSFR